MSDPITEPCPACLAPPQVHCECLLEDPGLQVDLVRLAREALTASEYGLNVLKVLEDEPGYVRIPVEHSIRLIAKLGRVNQDAQATLSRIKEPK